jgi:hypothetical protein
MSRPRRDHHSMPDCPDFRLTVRRGAVLAIDWSPWLATGGPLMTMLHARGRAGVGFADVTVLREDDVAAEAIVRFLAGDSPAAREAVVRWASDVGYRRIWLHDVPFDLPGPHEDDAETRCNGCAVRLYDGGPEFWEHVRGVGRFPSMCALCGADLPQWRVRQKSPAASDPARMGRPGRTSCR